MRENKNKPKACFVTGSFAEVCRWTEIDMHFGLNKFSTLVWSHSCRLMPNTAINISDVIIFRIISFWLLSELL